MDCQENNTYLIKMIEYDKYRFKSKEKRKYVKKETSYCVGCREKKRKKHKRSSIRKSNRATKVNVC